MRRHLRREEDQDEAKWKGSSLIIKHGGPMTENYPSLIYLLTLTAWEEIRFSPLDQVIWMLDKVLHVIVESTMLMDLGTSE